MNEKAEHPIKVLFRFAGDQKGKMPLSIALALLGELCGMLPFLAAAMLANEAYAGRATIISAGQWAGLAAAGVLLRTLFCTISSARSEHPAGHCRPYAARSLRRDVGDTVRSI